MNARTFRATQLQANDLPWYQQQGEGSVPSVWGLTLVPRPFYDSYDEEGNGVGEPLYYEWTALLAPEVALPDWITEVTS